MRIASATLIIVPLILIGGILLQIFLSRSQNKWLGLILPSITLVFSLLQVLNVAVLPGMSGTEVFMIIALAFLLSNIPTVVLLAIYFACRKKQAARSQLDKMNIQDLS